MSKKKPDIHFGIREIKELEFFVDEQQRVKGAFDFNYSVDVFVNIKSALVTMVVNASYFRNPDKKLFLKGKVSTSFFIKDMKAYVRDRDGIDIPEQLWVTFFGIAFTHARAILARSSAGTRFAGMLMPVIDPQREFKRLFGKSPELENV